jgi:hypothetical protein
MIEGETLSEQLPLDLPDERCIAGNCQALEAPTKKASFIAT